MCVCVLWGGVVKWNINVRKDNGMSVEMLVFSLYREIVCVLRAFNGTIYRRKYSTVVFGG